jgi:AraC family transcriptional regulator of adaptative response / DNA-3-methyladenine glycosylase II
MQTAARYERARVSRDPRFDGRSFVGVRTTGIYCRPICPAVLPKRENVTLFDTAAAASEAGYRPCLRCRPEAAPGSPAWGGTSTTVRRGLRLIADGALDEGGVEALAARLGVSSRHLRRLFEQHVGASPQAIAHTERLHFAKSLIDQTGLSMADIAVAAGYGSTRRFNDAVKQAWNKSPCELRRLRSLERQGDGLVLRLPYYEPYDWPLLLDFFRGRAMTGVEYVDDDTYHRVLSTKSGPGLVAVTQGTGQLEVAVRGVKPGDLYPLVQSLRDVFDTDAPIADIAAVLGDDPLLSGLLKKHPGIRVPGVFGRFEHIVRAILGQQVSVRAATTLASRIAGRYGDEVPETLSAGGRLTHLFPTAERLKRARLESLGITRGRASTIRRVASALSAGELDVAATTGPTEFADALLSLKGVGPWTVEYVLLRAMKDPDAFPASDLGVIKALSRDSGTRLPVKDIAQRAERWRPWRAYAALLLWHHEPAGG